MAYMTTRDVALKLKCTEAAALHLLKAASVGSRRAGGAYLWDAPDVERLLAALQRSQDSNRDCVCHEGKASNG